MRIIKMTLENFQGVKNEEYVFNKKDTSIYGDNATGKTTIFNAFTWVLFNRSSENAAGFSPKPIDGNEEVHNIDTAVEMEFMHDSVIGETQTEQPQTIRKVFREIWKKKRGNAKAEFSGHETEYLINGVPCRQKDFNEFLDRLGSDEQIKSLTSPEYFASVMKWQDRRSLLVSICGNITDSEVYDKEKELMELAQLKGSNTIEDFKKITGAAMKKTNDELRTIPERIDECKRSINNEKIGIKEVEEEFSRLSIEQATLQHKRAGLTNGGAMAELKNKLYKKEEQLSKERMKFAEVENKRLKSSYDVIANLQNQLNDNRQLYANINEDVSAQQIELDNVKIKREQLLAEYKKTQEETFDENDIVCRTCGQNLPSDKVAEMRGGFNERKSKHLMELNKKGKSEASKEIIAQMEIELQTAQDRLEEIKSEAKQIKAEIEKENAKLEVAQSGKQAFECTEVYQTLTGEINAIKDKMTDGSTAEIEATEEIDKKLTEISKRLGELSEMKASIKFSEGQKVRLAELEDKQKTLGEEYVKLEKSLYFCELFIRTKMSMVDEKINEKFKTVKFRLFESNITNDGIKECCDMLIPSPYGDYIEWSAANHAARVNAGLEIISALSKHWGKEFPVWIDNAESVTNFVDVEPQVIKLIVSETDKNLRIETE